MKPPASKKTQLLRIEQVAVILNCSRRSIYRLIGDCELSALKVTLILDDTVKKLAMDHISEVIGQVDNNEGTA